MYTTVRLDADLSGLTEREKQMLPLLMDAARAMDEIFWLEAVGQRDSVLSKITHDGMRRFVEINYGPWDRLNGNRPFLAEVGELPPGENFYPHDITRAEFDSLAALAPDSGRALRGLYTLVRRNGSGGLTAVPYHVAYKPIVERAAAKLRAAATLADDPGLRRYLELDTDEICAEMGLPTEGAVRALLSRAQARLSGLLSRTQEG